MSINQLKYLVLTSFILSPLLNTYSQQKFLQFRHLTLDDGLSSSSVVSVLQDYKGFMWFGTYEGLNRYDGINFIVYKNIPTDSASLPENHVWTIFEDRNKNLLLGTDQGLSLYDRDLDRFVNYKYEKSSALYDIEITVFRIAEDSTGNLWLATDNGLVYFDRNNNKVVQYRHNPDNPGSISFNYMEYVYIDKSGRLWIATRKGLNLLNPKTGNFEHITHCKTHNENIAEDYYLDIIEDKEGNIWFGSTDGLFCLENQHDKEKMELVHFTNNPVDPNSVSNNPTKSLFIDDKGNLWIGTENGGINLYDRDKKKFLHYRTDEFNPMSLNNESIWAFTQDRNNNLWVCTYGGGVNIPIKNSDFIIHYKNIPGAMQSLSHNIVSCFLEDRYNRKWVGTDGGGFNLFNDKTGRFIRFNMNNSKLKSNAILCMIEGTENQIWMGTWAGGLVSYNYVTNTIKSFTIQNSGIPDNNIYSIAKDEIGNLWLASFRHGLIYYQIKENKFITYSPENSNIDNTRISVVRIDNKGQLYLGATNSLQIFIPGENRFISYTNIPADTNSLSYNRVYDILIGNDTCIWIATQNGLNRFNPVNKNFKRYYKEDGLPDNTIKGLTSDKSGMLWVTTNSGICRFDYRNNKFKNFTKLDGLQSNEFTEKSILTTNSGAILAGGINGFNLISPEKISENKNIPEVVITDFHIFNEQVKPDIKGSPLKKQISETKKITLTYKQSVLTFYFSVMDFTNPRKNQYAYWMENFDKNWIYSDNRREATYTNLNPGKYIFHVKGSNNDGIWNETGTALEIYIRPPWWKTNVALTSFVLLIIFLFLGFYFFRINQLQKQKELLEKLVKERTHEIEEKNGILYKQTIELNESNVLLEEQQQQIKEQNEMLVHQAEKLNETNSLLEKRKEEITLQNDELERHRYHLEHMVDERTSELVKAKIKAEESDRLKSAFLANMSHEIRTPMNAIYGFSGLLNSESLSKEKKTKYINLISENCESLLVLIDDILDISAIEVDGLVFTNEKYNVDDILINLERFFKLHNEKDIEFEFINKPQKNGLIIYNEKVRFRQIFTNLLNNAFKYTESGNIRFGYEVFEKFVRFFVSDTGIGINKSEIDKIFDQFYKIENNSVKLYRGTGLGLAICKKIVEMMGGEIWVESVLNQGSVFYFTLPYVNDISQTQDQNKRVVQKKFNLKNFTILVAEDTPTNFELINSMLEPFGAEIRWAQNGQEAIEFVKSNPDIENCIILMDIKMPVVDGYEANRQIKAVNDKIPVIAVTAYAQSMDKKKILNEKFDDYISKPIKIETLLAALLKYSVKGR
jgi:signal transduction histidine kinase/ligand-binding sensor domain-containing protein/CheY-like chemotaxis protein